MSRRPDLRAPSEIASERRRLELALILVALAAISIIAPAVTAKSDRAENGAAP